MILWTFTSGKGWTKRGRASAALYASLRGKYAAIVSLPENGYPAPSARKGSK